MRYQLFQLIAVCVLPVMFCAGCNEAVGNEKDAAEEIIRPVRAVKLTDVEMSGTRSFPGRAEAVREVNLAFEVAGTLVERQVNKGDRVTKGQVLARLDPRDFENSLNASKAEEARARANYNRIARAAATGAVSKQDLTNAKADLNVAVADVKIKAKAMEDTHLVAPFDGTIAATYLENHQQIQAKQQVLRLVDNSEIEFTVNIPEKMISAIPRMTDISVRFDAFPDRDIPAKIKEVGTEASRTTRTWPVTLIMAQPGDIEILPGMAGKSFGWSDIRDEMRGTGFEIPVAAVFENNGKSHVWVIDEKSGAVSRRAVSTGGLTNDGILIREGVGADQWIATAGVHHLEEGQKVRIMADDGRETVQ
ncbi:efflux RND transporter periplasmic adaptor subun it [Desulfonema ishimotonii]|uniref:Efflux RND transporter periplasmic adaptor subun it n=1 Tax=Desulfonema ishimotonii TaxID=45657 RepID=A0A401FWJ0_9BACT|nr:efflux RND transporter periplasmic adaptor subunit [Desulfonema ishimotonii]GBC61330.1 efflux RND transporter periplasmic adaptor subun it [Desulfonema ishimotonii]